MTLFEAVHNGVTAREAAEYCGININRNDMACCPFHDDHTPSMKIDDHYFCFGCGEHGDSIDFYSKYNECSKKDAALQLADVFHIVYENEIPGITHKSGLIRRTPIKTKSPKQLRKEAVNSFWSDITEYYQILLAQMDQYSPKLSTKGEITWDDRYVTAVNQIPYIEYLMDCFISGNEEEQDIIIQEYHPITSSEYL